MQNDRRESVIMQSGQCSTEWLAACLSRPWFGGDLAVLFDPKTKDIVPVRFDHWGNGTNGGLS